MAKILPVFSYACGAWYLPRDACANYKMNCDHFEKLENLHRDFLLDLSGGMRGTLVEVLFKELHIHRMSTFLEKTAMIQRARELDTPQHKQLCRIRAQAWPGQRRSPAESHPYHQLDTIARQLLDDALNSRPGDGEPDLRKCVKQLADQRAEEASRAAWEDHKLARITERPGRIPAAYSDPRGLGTAQPGAVCQSAPAPVDHATPVQGRGHCFERNPVHTARAQKQRGQVQGYALLPMWPSETDRRAHVQLLSRSGGGQG